MSAVTPFILERAAGRAARAAQEQIKELKQQNKHLEELLKFALAEAERKEKTIAR
jgi:cell shape-determining protein MreC